MIACPLHFVLRGPFADLARIIDFHNRAQFWRELTQTTEGAWGLHSYVLLREFGWPVTCSAEYDPAAINVISADAIDRTVVRPRCFVVALQSDLRWYPLADWYIVQNPTQHNLARKRAYLPHWLPPLVLPRSKDRAVVQNIGLMGIPWIRAMPTAFWGRMAGEAGMRVIDLWRENRWHDYSDIDVLLAIRSLDNRTHDRKPPWKLFCAWEARVPLIAGRDSAYSYHGVPGVNYCVATSADEVLETLKDLRINAHRYSMLVEKGVEAIEGVSVSRTVERWEDVFCRYICPEFERMRRNGRGLRDAPRLSLASGRQLARFVLRSWGRSVRRILRRAE